MTTPQYRAQIIQGGQVVATASGGDCDKAWQEGEHYLRVYSQDGPAELKVAERRGKRWLAIGGSVTLATSHR